MNVLQRICWLVAAISGVLLAAGLASGSASLWQPAAVVACVGAAIGLGGLPTLRGYQFTAWIVAAVVGAMIYPDSLVRLGTINLRDPWIILLVVQLVMFGMGTQMSLRDFAGVARMPWGVLVGIVSQFTIMPLVGFALTKVFTLPDEIAAGIVLIGACSSGLASNVMVYLARGNLALSVTLTSVTTLLAPVMTPTWMKVLAGELVAVDFFKMMHDVVKMVIVPIGAALVHDYLKRSGPSGRRCVLGLAAMAFAWLAFIMTGGRATLAALLNDRAMASVDLAGFVLGATIVGVAYHALVRWMPRIERAMPRLSMFGIVYFTAVTTAAGRDDLLRVGAMLFLAAVIHNTLGYVLGYWLSRALGLDRTSARTVAFEVGLQNGGMASGLAGAMGKLGTVGLAAAVFSPWMNVSGSVLANYWRRRPADDGGYDKPPLAD